MTPVWHELAKKPPKLISIAAMPEVDSIVYSQYLQVQGYEFSEIGGMKLSIPKMLAIKMPEYTKRATEREHYGHIACLLTAAGYASGTLGVTEPGTLRMLLWRYRQVAKRPRSLDSMLKPVQPAVDVEKIIVSITFPRVRKGFGHRLAVGTSAQDLLEMPISER